ncbi:SGNH/GDSL hydrolase family protein [bacterium]
MKKTTLLIVSIFLFIGGVIPMLQASQFIPANHPNIQYFGRWDQTDPLQPKHSWPGVYIILKFTGTRIGIRMTDNVNYYNISIDGKHQGIIHGNQSEEADYSLADGLVNTEHTCRLSKRNTSFEQMFSISGFLLDDGAELLEPAPSPERKIEFLGNSFTAAEGNEATELEMEWTAKMPVTNIDLGFAPVIARHFNAQYATTCRPGIGMANDWQGNLEMALPKRFDRALMDFQEPKWDFQKWIPDLVVIILGLNDYSGFGGWRGEVSAANSELYRTKYHDFITTIRNVYPDIKICAVAAHVPWIREQVKQVVKAEQVAGHIDIFYAQFDEFEGGYVANGHPTVETHQKMADQIIEVIEANKIFKSF